MASLWSTRFRAMRSVQAYTRDALQLHRRPISVKVTSTPAEASTTAGRGSSWAWIPSSSNLNMSTPSPSLSPRRHRKCKTSAPSLDVYVPTNLRSSKTPKWDGEKAANRLTALKWLVSHRASEHDRRREYCDGRIEIECVHGPPEGVALHTTLPKPGSAPRTAPMCLRTMSAGEGFGIKQHGRFGPSRSASVHRADQMRKSRQETADHRPSPCLMAG
jgi:hypothetical protein